MEDEAHGHDVPPVTNQTFNFRTDMCKYLEKCTKVPCRFAHSPPELRSRAANLDVLKGVAKDDLSSALVYKTTLCRYHKEGQCSARGDCRFAHNEDELRSTKHNQEAIGELKREIGMRGTPPDANLQVLNYRVRDCREGTACKRRGTCYFAHSPQERRTQGSNVTAVRAMFYEQRGRQDPLRFKTIRCSNGDACPMRPTCCFAHDDGELRTVEDNRAALQELRIIANSDLAPPGWTPSQAQAKRQTVRSVEELPEAALTFRTVLCTQPNCRDASCMRAHGATQLRTEAANKNLAAAVRSGESARQGASAYKCKPCGYHSTGKCYNEVACRFAHGDAELRTPDFNRGEMAIFETLLGPAAAAAKAG